MQKTICRFSGMLFIIGVLAAVQVMPAQAAPTALAVTNALNKNLRERITSPGGKMVVKITPGPRAAQGYFNEVYIAAKPAAIKNRRFSELVLRARNVRLDVNQLMQGELETLSSQTSLRATITEGELTNALARGQESGGMKLKVKFSDTGQVRVTGLWKWSWFSGPMEAIGKLRLGPNYTVVADVQTLKLNGANVPPAAKNRFQERINPLIDYRDLPFRPPFKSLKFSAGKAFITA